MELAVDFEINPPDGSATARPYVAVWLEDQDGNPVRTLSLWVEKSGAASRWISGSAPLVPRRHRAVYDVGRAGPDYDGLQRDPDAGQILRWSGTAGTTGAGPSRRARTPSTWKRRAITARTRWLQKTVEIGPKPFTAAVAGNEETQRGDD